MPGERELATESTASARLRWLIPVCAVVLLAAVYAGFCAVAVSRDAIAPHTTVGGVDVGGLTRAEAARAIGGALDALRAGTGVRVTLEDGADAAYLSYAALGADFDANALADAAYRASHGGSALADGWTLLRATLGYRIQLPPEPIEGWTQNAARTLASAAELEPIDFSYALADGGTLWLTRPRDGRTVDETELRARLDRSEPDGSGARGVALPYTLLPAERGDLAALSARLGGEMTNARYDAETETILPEHTSIRFDAARAQALLDAAAPGETVGVPAEVFTPTVTAAELETVLFRDVLGTYTTRVGGTAGRRSNVRLTAERVNGAVLNSGEEFNYYALTGPFTAENGYLPAPGYLHGKTVDMDGGGACQCSSTAYAAALLANLEIVARTAHGFASDYIGLGLDATVSGGGPDFIFRNNTPYPIKIETEYSDKHRLTVSILGTKTDDTTVKMRVAVLSSTPYAEQVIEDPSLAPGERVVDVTPYTGYTVKTYRQLWDGEGNLLSETFEASSRYNKRDRVVRVGPAIVEAAPVEDAAAEAPVEDMPADVPVEVPTETPADGEAPPEAEL